MANGEKICAKKTFYSPQVPRKVVTTIHPAFYHQVLFNDFRDISDLNAIGLNPLVYNIRFGDVAISQISILNHTIFFTDLDQGREILS
jgi:hypothetical protein